MCGYVDAGWRHDVTCRACQCGPGSTGAWPMQDRFRLMASAVVSASGVSGSWTLGAAKPLVVEAIDQNPHPVLGAPVAFLPCRAAVVAQDPHVRVQDHPPPPQGDRVAVAEAGSRPAGPAGPGLPAERR